MILRRWLKLKKGGELGSNPFFGMIVGIEIAKKIVYADKIHNGHGAGIVAR